MTTYPPPQAQTKVEYKQTRRDHKNWAIITILGLLVAMFLLGGDTLGKLVETPMVSTWVTVMTAIVVSAIPFLTIGVLLSALVSIIPESYLTRLLPQSDPLKVVVAGGGGLLLPGCECATVPLSRSLMSKGVLPGAALAFALAAPAINPVVLVATSVAFPNTPEMTLARLVASLGVAIIVGLTWVRYGKGNLMPRFTRRTQDDTLSRPRRFLNTVEHDLLQAGGMLVVGGMFAATANVLIPPEVMESFAGNLIMAVLVLGTLAFVVAICSEADAFVAASLTMFPKTAQLAFIVVGPAMDIKLLFLHGGVFGWKFATRFAPVVVVVAIACALLVGTVIL